MWNHFNHGYHPQDSDGLLNGCASVLLVCHLANLCGMESILFLQHMFKTDDIGLAEDKIDVFEGFGCPEALHTVHLARLRYCNIKNGSVGNIGSCMRDYSLKTCSMLCPVKWYHL